LTSGTATVGNRGAIGWSADGAAGSFNGGATGCDELAGGRAAGDDDIGDGTGTGAGAGVTADPADAGVVGGS
jgi:hypothetical protein